MSIFRNLLLILSLVPVLPFKAMCQENPERYGPLLERLSVQNRSGNLIYENPAMQPMRYSKSLSRLEGGFLYKEQSEPFLVQEGDGRHTASFDADTYIRIKDNTVVWGDAEYTNGIRKNIGWSETSDLLRVYPYFTADSLGGDLYGESYFFRGGYAAAHKKMNFGLQMSYCSRLEYRKKDPRPKNNTGYINAALGVAWKLNPEYMLGGYLFAERYTQKHNIVFLNDLGVISVYHMQGLGMHYSRFAGSRRAAYYKGRDFKLGMTLLSIDKRGMEVGVQIGNYRLQKQLPSLNDAPINDLDQWKTDVDLVWRGKRYYIDFSAVYASRKGKERIYDDGSSNWQEISSTKPFKATYLEAGLSAGREWEVAEKWNVQLVPALSFNLNEMTYTPVRQQKTGSADFQLDGTVRYAGKRNMVLMDLGILYRMNCMAEQRIDNPDYFIPAYESVLHNYRMMSSDITGGNASAEWHYSMKKWIRTVFLKVKYFYNKGSMDYKMNYLSAGLGVTL